MKKTSLHNDWNILKEKEASLKEFLQKAEGQLKGIEESIAFTNVQITKKK